MRLSYIIILLFAIKKSISNSTDIYRPIEMAKPIKYHNASIIEGKFVETQCALFCKANANCNYFNLMDNGNCGLGSKLASLDRIGDKTKVYTNKPTQQTIGEGIFMLYGGITNGSTVSFYDLPNKRVYSGPCPFPPLPDSSEKRVILLAPTMDNRGFAGCAWLNGGGRNCFTFSRNSESGYIFKTNILSANRQWSGGITLTTGMMWIVGGHNPRTDKTDYVNPDTLAVTPGPTLPIIMADPCVQYINSSAIGVIGGETSDPSGSNRRNLDTIYVLDIGTSQFTQVTPGLGAPGYSESGCGVYKNSKIMLFGGLGVGNKCVSVDKDGLKVRSCGSLPANDQVMVTLEFQGDLYYMGGKYSKNQIYKYNGGTSGVTFELYATLTDHYRYNNGVLKVHPNLQWDWTC